MKLITLNLWGGIVYEPLLEFIRREAASTDIFCFQEMLFGDRPEFTSVHRARVNLFQELSKLLPEFQAYPWPVLESTHFRSEPIDGFHSGQAIFMRQGIKVGTSGGFLTYRGESPSGTKSALLTGRCQWLEFGHNQEKFLLLNIHGLWQKDKNKIDTPERLVQSAIIKEFLASKSGKIIFVGDFNLIPDGQAFAILAEGFNDLIKKFNVQSTRTSFYTEPCRFADYILISPEIEVKNFAVLPDIVSDHLSLMLEF